MAESTTPTRESLIRQLTAPGLEYELMPGEVWGRPCRIFKNGPISLRELFEDTRSDETFLVYEHERYSFEDVYQRSCAIARILIEDYGIRKGDRVAISMRNYPEWVMCFNAITSVGAIAVAMNALWLSDEMAFGLSDSGARVLFADQERLDRLAAVHSELPDLKVIAIRPARELPHDVPNLHSLLSKWLGATMPDITLGPDDPAIIYYTSGSTGHPKGAVSCHRNIITSLMSWELDGQMGLALLPEAPEPPNYQPATLLAVPLFHATGSHAVMLASYRAQRKMICMYKWDLNEATRLIEQEKVSSFVAPAAMTGDLVAQARVSDRDLSSLVAVGGGGAPRAPEQVKNIAHSFARAMPNTGWGMTETNAIGTGIGGNDYLEHPGSSGRCAACLDIRIVDTEGRELAAGERGEVQICGSSVFQGYWNRPDANLQAFDGYWLRTGDVGYLDANGYLYIVDRIKDLVIRGGENIGCAEVEAALLEHAAVQEASVYAVPDDRLGEEVGASIYCSQPLREEEIRDFLQSRVARFKMPRYITFTQEPLPRIASGKINKRAIREQAVSRLTALASNGQ